MARRRDRPPADKYRLFTERTFGVLAAVCQAPALAGRDLVRQLAFAYLSGNGDAHAKNFSVVCDLSGEWRVAPVCDVPCSYVYGDVTMAMPVGARVGSDFGVKDFVALGRPSAYPSVPPDEVWPSWSSARIVGSPIWTHSPSIAAW